MTAPTMTHRLAAELIGTFWLVLGGCGAAVFAADPAGDLSIGIGYTGKRAVQLLRGMRLQRACVLLQRGELSISEVAYETGFTTPAYFSRIFSREMGFPPSEYQGVNRNKI